MKYRYGSHTISKIQYHELRGDVGLRVRELIRETR